MLDAETLFRTAVQVEQSVDETIELAPAEHREVFLLGMISFMQDCLLIKASKSIDEISEESKNNLLSFVRGDEQSIIVANKSVEIEIQRQEGWGIHVVAVNFLMRLTH